MGIWCDTFHNKAVADALMDRLIHGSYHIQLLGESLRKARSIGTKTGRKNPK
jgi:hypothetical protein